MHTDERIERYQRQNGCQALTPKQWRRVQQSARRRGEEVPTYVPLLIGKVDGKSSGYEVPAVIVDELSTFKPIGASLPGGGWVDFTTPDRPTRGTCPVCKTRQKLTTRQKIGSHAGCVGAGHDPLAE